METVNEYILTNATLFDGINSSLLENSLVHIKDGKIIKISTTSNDKNYPSTATIIDLKGKFIIPGLIDSHIHFFQGSGLYTWPNVLDLRHIKPYEKAMAEIHDSLPELFKRYLACGVTGVVSCGGPMFDFTIKERSNRKEIIAPDIEVAGPFASPVSVEKLTLDDDPPIIRVDTLDIIRDLVKRCAEKKAVFIKILYHKIGLFASDTEKIALIIQESKKVGLRVAVHATELETAKTAVKLGVDILVHSVCDEDNDEEFIALLKKKHFIYIPTLMVRQGVRDVFRARLNLSDFEQKFGDPKVLQSFRDILTIPLEKIPETHRYLVHLGDKDLPDYNKFSFPNLKRIVNAGIIIAAGTDAGNVGTLHGPSLHYELELMVKAGMKPLDVLISATKHSANVMNRTDIGTLEVGKKANLVILDKNPLDDITNTRKIYKIMKDGNLFSPTDLCKPTLPADIVDRQIEAYNAHKIDDLIATYHPKIQVYSLLSEKIVLNELDELYAYYVNVFTTSPQIKTQTLNRIINGSLIIDFQHITGKKDMSNYDISIIYEIKNHFIIRIWLGK